MRHTAAVACGIGLLVVCVVLFAASPDLAFWVFFAMLTLAAPFIVVIGALRWIVKRHKGGQHGKQR